MQESEITILKDSECQTETEEISQDVIVTSPALLDIFGIVDPTTVYLAHFHTYRNPPFSVILRYLLILY